jgi:protein gp37
MTPRTDGTKIQWAHVPGYQRGETWNPTRGCSRISPGCEACYAERHAGRFSAPGEPFHGFVERKPKMVDGAPVLKRGLPVLGPARWTRKVELMPHMLDEPLRTRIPTSYFVNSMSDLFHESLTDEEIAAVFGVMAACPRHLFIVLTKRAERMTQWFEWMAAGSAARVARGYMVGPQGQVVQWPLPSVWIGVSVESPDYLHRLDELRKVPAAVRFVSYEPALADLERVNLDGIHWVIVGGESGPGARPFNVVWARSIIGQCKAAGVACFVKQLGAVAMEDTPVVGRKYKVGNVLALDDRKGGDMSEWPADLRVREFPVLP